MILSSPTSSSTPRRRHSSRLPRLRASRNRCGLTLIELVMVVLIIGILTAVSAPRISASLDTRSVDAATSLLQAELKGAQQLAITRSSTVTIDFTQANHQWQVSFLRDSRKEIARSVTLSGSPWNCQLSSLLTGNTQEATKTASLTVNGAGVWGTTLRIGIACGRAESRVIVDASSGTIAVEQVSR